MKIVVALLILCIVLGVVASLFWSAVKWICIAGVLAFVLWKIKGLLLKSEK